MKRLALLLALLATPAVAQVPPTLPSNSAPISGAGTSTFQIIPMSGGTTYITGVMIWGHIGDSFQLVAGTGTNCGANQTPLTGVLSPFEPLTWGDGSGVLLRAPGGYAVCGVGISTYPWAGALSYRQY
jgi:hypothetical protein